MKKHCFLCLILVALLCFSACPSAMAQESQENGCVSLLAQKPLDGTDKKLDTAKSVILYELDSQTLVYAYQPDLRIPVSGMNKIMTALLALENVQLDEIATVSRKALDSVPVGSVSANLKRDEQMSILDLLYCMMVGSANDAAAVIAEYVGGSQETFVEMMNLRAVELGCKDTIFCDATGVRGDGQHTTARDLALITETALQNDVFVEIFSTVSYTVERTNKAAARELLTSNNMMRPANKNYYDPRLTGGRTGASSTTDRSLICTAEENGCRYLSIVMSAAGSVTNDPNIVDKYGSYEETKQLLDYAFTNFSVFNLMLSDHAMAQFPVENGENMVSVSPAQTVRVALPKGTQLSQISFRSVQNGSLTAPVQKGAVLGHVEAWYNGICVAKYDLLAMHDVYAQEQSIQSLEKEHQNDAQEQTDKVVRNITAWAVIVALFGASAVFAVLFIRRFKKKRAERKANSAMNVQRSK